MSELYNFNIDSDEVIIHKSSALAKIQLIVNGEKVNSKMTWIGGKKEYDYKIGSHLVKINVKVPSLFPAFRSWEYRVFLDDKEIASFSK
jgi:hypothetical protein